MTDNRTPPGYIPLTHHTLGGGASSHYDGNGSEVGRHGERCSGRASDNGRRSASGKRSSGSEGRGRKRSIKRK